MNHLLFNNCEELMRKFKSVNYKKNMIIANEGDECHYIGLIISGTVSIYTNTYTEGEYEIASFHEGDIFGEFLVFNSSNLFLGNVVAFSDCEIIKIYYNDLLVLLKNEYFLINYMKIISNVSMMQQQKIKILAQKTIRDKIMFYLSSISKRNKTKIINVKSKESLASLLNIPRPSLSRELILLKNEGIIDYNLHYIKILI